MTNEQDAPGGAKPASEATSGAPSDRSPRSGDGDGGSGDQRPPRGDKPMGGDRPPRRNDQRGFQDRPPQRDGGGFQDRRSGGGGGWGGDRPPRDRRPGNDRFDDRGPNRGFDRGGNRGGFGGRRDDRGGGDGFRDRRGGFGDRDRGGRFDGPPRRDQQGGRPPRFNDGDRRWQDDGPPRRFDDRGPGGPGGPGGRGGFERRPRRDFDDRGPRDDRPRDDRREFRNDGPPRESRPPRDDRPRDDRRDFRPPRRFDNHTGPRHDGFQDRPPRREFDDRPPRRFDNDRGPRRDFDDRGPRPGGGFRNDHPGGGFRDRGPRQGGFRDGGGGFGGGGFGGWHGPPIDLNSPLPGFSSIQRQDGSARYEAARLLLRWEETRVHADALLEASLRNFPLEDPRDRGLLHELFLGVLRRRDQLDVAITELGGRPVQQQPAGLRQVLRLGLYQLFFLDRIPPHAAIHETVGLAIGPLRPAANAILREAQRRGAEVMKPGEDTDPADRAALDAGAPRWMWDYLSGAFGDERARAILTQAFVVPPLTLRANTLQTTRDELLERIKPRGFGNAAPTPHSPLGIVLGEVEDSRSPDQWPFLKEGAATVQDESSQMAALLLAPQPGQRVLDLCAAPGGKATLLAAAMNNTGDLVATDISDAKRRAIRKLARRVGASIVRVCEAPEVGGIWPADGPLSGPPFDAILVDAPCSGFGTLSRHPDIRWSRARGELDELAKIQASLLRAVWKRLRPGGRLLYSTCTLGPTENQDVVAAFLADTPDAIVAVPTVEEFPWLPADTVTPEGYFQTFGEAGVRDGFFAARIEKRAIT